MIKLDSSKHKAYVRRDGAMALFVDEGTIYEWAVSGDIDGNVWRPDGAELPGEWLPVELPEFPDPKPPQIYARPMNHVVGYYDSPRWWTIWGSVAGAGGRVYSTRVLEIVEHPDNDEEAVRLVNEARGE